MNAELKAAAVEAGMVDLDWLNLIDLSKYSGDADAIATAAVTALKAAKPHIFANQINSPNPLETTHMKTTFEIEQAARGVKEAEAALDAARRKHADAVADQAPPKKLSEMTPAERKADAKRRGITGPI